MVLFFLAFAVVLIFSLYSRLELTKLPLEKMDWPVR
jgi:hypothetical protein